ncbi:MAG: hypothetical protein WAT46_10880 [Saprospiraceae bacterium]|jgi:hypothetical protein|nr:hypothetical protein [Saprospiraceae bacterium]MBK9565784.1 hypothetical protein [Saprospiraceae bacterium]
MSRVISTNVIRILLLFFSQIWIFKQASFPIGNISNVHFLIYPMAILLLPVKTTRSLLLIIAFVFGICLDMFYDSPGIHAAALVFTAYIRNIVIALLEPFSGYNIDDVPTIKQLGFSWFISYISILLLLHFFVYFSIEAFSFVYIFEIFLSSVFSFICSFIVVMIIQFIFNTKY